jgi:hypothetical protein
LSQLVDDFREYHRSRYDSLMNISLVEAATVGEEKEHSSTNSISPNPLLQTIKNNNVPHNNLQIVESDSRSISFNSRSTNINNTTANIALRKKKNNIFLPPINSAFIAYPILLHRSFTNGIRQPVLFYNRITQCMFFGLILACFYAPCNQDTQASIQNRIGLIYNLTVVNFIGMLNCVAAFPQERDIFIREFYDDTYPAYAFVLSYYSIAIPLTVFAAMALCLIAAWSTSLLSSFHDTMQFSYIVWIYVMTGEAIGVIFCLLLKQVGFAVNIMSAVLPILGIMCGFISLNIPKILEMIAKVWPNTWGSYIYANIVFRGLTFQCDGSDTNNNYYYQATNSTTCALQTGEDVLELYNFTSANPFFGIPLHYLMMTILFIVYFVLSFVAVQWKAWKLLHS